MSGKTASLTSWRGGQVLFWDIVSVKYPVFQEKKSICVLQDSLCTTHSTFCSPDLPFGWVTWFSPSLPLCLYPSFTPAHSAVFKLLSVSIICGAFKTSFTLQTDRLKPEGSHGRQELNSVCLQHHSCGNSCFIYPFIHSSSRQRELENPLQGISPSLFVIWKALFVMLADLFQAGGLRSWNDP